MIKKKILKTIWFPVGTETKTRERHTNNNQIREKL